jgi:hypothetical protein
MLRRNCSIPLQGNKTTRRRVAHNSIIHRSDSLTTGNVSFTKLSKHEITREEDDFFKQAKLLVRNKQAVYIHPAHMEIHVDITGTKY